MPIQPQPPPDEQPNPFLPNAQEPNIFEEFAGINTSTSRYGVDDKQMSWCDGWFVVGPRQIRTMYGIGAALYTATGILTIVFFDFYNIAAVPYMVVFLSDGSIDQVRTTDGAITHIAPAATIVAPTRNTIDVTQWGSQYLIIVAQQLNGYWVWDGSVLFTAGGVSPVVTLTNVGSGYKTVPSVTAQGGGGSGAVFSATIANGVVTGVTVVKPGSGYLANNTVNLVFSGGNSGGSGAALTAVLSGTVGSGASLTAVMTQNSSGITPFWFVSGVTINSGGANYTQFTSVTVDAATGISGVTAQLSLVISAGVITGVNIINPGHYPSAGPPGVTVTDNGQFFVTSVTISNGGSGYSPSAVATCTLGGTPQSQASLVLTITAGVITAVTVTNGGVYGSNSAPTVTVTDTVTNAAGTITLMPFAIQGNAVETYQGRVWVANLAAFSWTAPGSFNNFATSAGGGNQISSDSWLRVTYVRLRSTNGFLYLVGDSSISYISGVQTSGSPPTTTFTNQNADPEVGTPYPATVTVFGRNIMFANAFGVQVSLGATVTKISEPLDGVYATVANFGGLNLSAAKATIFGKKCWVLLSMIVDPVSLATTNKLFVWSGDHKLWTSTPQDVTLTYIQHQEINSVLTAFGTDGTHIYPLFAQASTGFTKTVQSRLWAAPGGYQFVKASARLWMILGGPDTSPISVQVSVDGDQQQAANFVTYSIASSATPPVYVLSPTTVGQIGALTGLTIKTQQGDVSLWTAMLQNEVVQGKY